MSTVTVDPRLRARRVAVARDSGRRRLRRLVVVLVVAGLGLVVLGLTFTPALDVETVEVVGADRSSPEAVAAATGVAPGDPLAWFDPGAAAREVRALPWVAEAEVERSWSGRVTVRVTERVPVAAIDAGDGSWRLVDVDGRILAAVAGPPDAVIAVEGTGTTADPGAELEGEVLAALRVAGAVPPGLRPLVGTVAADAGGARLALRDGGSVLLGQVDDAEAAVAAAAAVLATVPPRCVERLDVTLPAAPALVRVPGCS